MESKKLVINEEMLAFLNMKLIDIETAHKMNTETKNVIVEWPPDEPFNIPTVTLEQAREAMKLLKRNEAINDLDKQIIIDDLMSIIRLVRYSDPKSWKVGRSGGQDSYAGLPDIMRTIDTELKKIGINLMEETK